MLRLLLKALLDNREESLQWKGNGGIVPIFASERFVKVREPKADISLRRAIGRCSRCRVGANIVPFKALLRKPRIIGADHMICIKANIVEGMAFLASSVVIKIECHHIPNIAFALPDVF